MSWLWGKRPDPNGGGGRAAGGRQVKEGITNIWRGLRGQPPQAPAQKMCPNGHYAAFEEQVCRFCGYRFF